MSWLMVIGWRWVDGGYLDGRIDDGTGVRRGLKEVIISARVWTWISITPLTLLPSLQEISIITT